MQTRDTVRAFRITCAAWLSLIIPALFGSSAWCDEIEGISFFREKIEPVLKSQCYGCHSGDADTVEGGLYLDSRAGMLRGGDSGSAVIPGESESSLLVRAIRHEDGLQMPPEKPKLPESVISDFERWINIGVPDPREETGNRNPVPFSEAARQHWAFQPIRAGAVPQVSNTDWVRSPVDAFILKKLEEQGWQPAPTAAREELIRRVFFALTGLPPSPDEIDEFLSDEQPDAWPRLVEQLLNSPRYGERAATHWLDVVRFAETEGYEYDRHIPDAWRFRDYVIESLNSDKPFDRFVTEQIAGDEIDPDNLVCQTASIFHRLGPVRRNAGNPEIALSRNEVLTERTDVIGAAFLGLTIGCARCHDHKLEPVSQRDYYRLEAYFAATEEHNLLLASAAEQQDWEARTRQAKQEIDALRARAKDADAVEKTRLEEQIERLQDQLPAPLPTIPATRNVMDQRTPIHVLRRGIWENKGEPVGPRPLSALVPDSLPELPVDAEHPRTQLARWLTSGDHPLTARVIVNRLWQQHFGTGLVKTVNDFGLKGDRPSHPELLDWLAATLIEHGWRLKPIHRLIVLSSIYQQSSELARGPQHTQDPDNRLLGHFLRRRLSAEEVRDAMLSVSGRLNEKSGGPGVMVPVDTELTQLLYKPSQWSIHSDPTEYDRRSVYLLAKRNLRLPFLETFDAPALLTSCGRRETSTHAPQALELLNGSLSNDLAIAFGRRLATESGGDQDRLVEMAFRLTLGRRPSSAEKTMSDEFLSDQPVHEFALALFNLNEFLYVR